MFNLHPEYSKIYVGGFPTTAKIQDTVRETFMFGQIEGLKIGGQEVGLWNYKKAHNIAGAPERNKFREQPVKDVRFVGNGFLALDRSNYADMNTEMAVKLSFRPDAENGLLFMAGDPDTGDFVSLELRYGYLTHSYNLGDGVVSAVSEMPVALKEWHTAEITRSGRIGQLSIDNVLQSQVASNGEMDSLSVSGDYYVGGYPASGAPFEGMSTSAANFTGCLKDVFIGQDAADLESYTQSVNTKKGCDLEAERMVTFPEAGAGYVQVQYHRDEEGGADGSDAGSSGIELTFMFRTGQRRALLAYLQDTNLMYFVSLSLVEGGALELRVFPQYEINTSVGESGKSTAYNDNEWHAVSIVVKQNMIQLHVDDHDYFSLKILDPSALLDLDVPYNIFLGGLPDSADVRSDTTATTAPYIGCMRDVLVHPHLVDFNKVDYSTGVELGVCRSEVPETGG